MSTGGWRNFKEVTEHVLDRRQLFRASAPNYNGISQHLTQAAVDFLTGKHINRIISLNKFRYGDAELSLLEPAGIEYLHLPVEDFTAPSLDQLLRAIAFYNREPSANILVHCGAGYGRTGTCITALQLFQLSGASPPESEWQSVNCVETDEQMEILRELRQHYQDQL